MASSKQSVYLHLSQASGGKVMYWYVTSKHMLSIVSSRRRITLDKASRPRNRYDDTASHDMVD